MDNTKTTTETIRHLSLCAGYGGIDLGLRRVLPNLRTVCYSEIEIFAINNLVEKMQQCPDLLHPAPIWTNLKTLPLQELGEILGSNSLISGGFPCQPFSCAGSRLGDEDPRHLFPYIKNAIRVIQPRIVFLENVQGIVSAKLKGDHWGDPEGTPVLLHVLRELERVGYRATAGIFSAEVDAGLPHQRKRVFILAHRKCKGLEGWCSSEGNDTEGREKSIGHPGASGVHDRESSFTPARPGQPQHWWEPPRVITGEEGQAIQGTDPTGGTHNQRETQPQVGGTPPGPATGVVPADLWETYQSLGVSTMNRASELMLLGNGVVPEVSARAFEILSKELEQ